MNSIHAVIFDFDGVILNSAHIKTSAFLELFKDYPQHQEAIREYHIENQGITRYNKFEWIYKQLLHKPYNKNIKEELGNKFSSIVFEKIIQADTIPGAIDFLKKLKNIGIPAYVASGTPDNELKKIIEGRKLSTYFKSVYGSNMSKEEAIDRIAKQESVQCPEMIFVGDAITDYKAAQSRGVPFVAVYSQEMEDYWGKRDIVPVRNLMEIYNERESTFLGE